MMNKPAVGAKRVASQRVASQTMIAKRVRLASDAACLAPPPCALQQPAQQSYDEVRCEALQPPSRGGPGMHGDDPNNHHSLSRRSILLAVAGVGTGAVMYASSVPVLFPEESTIVASPTGLSVVEAQHLCEESAATCATIYSQMTSTLRMAQSGFVDDDLFQATCARRLGSPYILEQFSTLQDAIPVLGMALAYPRNAVTRQTLVQLLYPQTFGKARTSAYETLTLTAVQRTRRVARVLKYMSIQGYTPTGLELMLTDLKALMGNLDQVLIEVPALL